MIITFAIHLTCYEVIYHKLLKKDKMANEIV